MSTYTSRVVIESCQDQLFSEGRKRPYWLRSVSEPCDGTMKIVSFIEEDEVIRKILKHCNLWKEPQPKPPPQIKAAAVTETGPYEVANR
jgi:hypothetical protein